MRRGRARGGDSQLESATEEKEGIRRAAAAQVLAEVLPAVLVAFVVDAHGSSFLVLQAPKRRGVGRRREHQERAPL